MNTPDIFVATCDLAGQVRGRGAPYEAYDSVLRSGLGWVPANLGISAFGGIPPGSAFGSTGDLRLIPDEATEITIPSDSYGTGLKLLLADQAQPDGSEWDCCPRTFLRKAVNDFREQTGLRIIATFEHEFVLEGLPPSAPFSLRRHRDADPFGTDLLRLLTNCGLAPENWLPEFGANQFEITVEPSDPLTAADRAVLLRELVRDLAIRRGLRASFAPLQEPNGTGTGVHVHISLVDDGGNPVMFDASRPGRLSEVGSRFGAGILRHAEALTAWTAPSPVSFLRLSPNRWSVGGIFLAERNREALLRICPTSSAGGSAPDHQFNLEYRAADATANPWLTLGVLLRAGLAGIVGGDEYPAPEIIPEDAGPAELMDVPLLPRTLDDALLALEKDQTARSWFHPDLLTTFLAVKRYEVAQLASLNDAARIKAVADVY
ncbi:glutamine synthetase [Arthrobacter sp. TES]|uniref:glutamine synthetase family protein n=1 Tax=Paenarthrobacter TaxID=1742992 RepID=UPI000396545A|nr:glutamine synthetase family protein [Paenarthrobacter ureafaciens]AMB39144.1 glutamine synthetase [Arthrobacter sp. ATCC 21022]AOY72955.1 Glutamine synthetase [Arthrobacter sp. ZXY-2]QOI64554.1 glutamine synthetase [Arthrobacter sp. TES]KUR66328.1 glutamine synthetase [Arthrobacter sp. ATCC 21022]MBN9131366.1 glutamine synthetase [Paenarthrobacter ureafaciens]